jgi:HD superfamily phosphohydrolase
MELATRVFDVVTSNNAVHPAIRPLLPEISQQPKLDYWRRVLRMAALCHDIGHLPFSHAAEKELLPAGWSHERLTVEIINSDEMRAIWNKMTPPLRSKEIAKLAVGPKILTNQTFSDWETILSEIIIGDAFGVDRIDYLLRDSHHAGVAYGKFDHYRLMDTLRILPITDTESNEPALGVEEGGIHSAEALLLARYFMYMQVYFHPIRRMYDLHLINFLSKWLPGGKFPTTPSQILEYTDIEVTNGIFEAARDSSRPGHDAAKRILDRKHFKVVYSHNPDDASKHPEPGCAIYAGLCKKYGSDKVHHDPFVEKGGVFYFPVLDRDERIVTSSQKSDTLANIPTVTVDNVFVDPIYADEAKQWVRCNRDSVLHRATKEER